MARADWGTKQQCTNTACAAKFYDFGRTPVVCPACGTTIDLTPQTRTRRSRSAEKAKAAAPVPAAAPIAAPVETPEAVDVDEDAEEEVIEDASELGEDEDDVAEVLETPLEDEEGT